MKKLRLWVVIVRKKGERRPTRTKEEERLREIGTRRKQQNNTKIGRKRENIHEEHTMWLHRYYYNKSMPVYISQLFQSVNSHKHNIKFQKQEIKTTATRCNM